MSDSITIGVLRHLHIQMLEGGQMCRVSEDGEEAGDMAEPVIVPTRAAAVAELRQRLGLGDNCAAVMPPTKAPITRASCTDEEAVERARMMAESEDCEVTLSILCDVAGVGPKRAARLMKKFFPAPTE